MAGNTREELLVAIQADISQLRQQMTQASNSMRQTGSDGESSFNSIGKAAASFSKTAVLAVAGVITSIAGIGTAAASAIGIMTNTIEESKGKLKAMTGVSDKEVTKMSNTVRNVYSKAWGESLGELTSDMGKLKSTLGTVDDKTLESTQILKGISENADIDSVARAIKGMTTNFPGLTQAKAMDLITTAFQKTGDASGDYRTIGFPA